MNEPVSAASWTTASEHEPVAVVGIACRLPGAQGPDDYWSLLEEGRSALTDTPQARRDDTLSGSTAAGLDGRPIPLRGGFLDAPADFDADFFGISPREAEAMDPQGRLVLELGQEALEHARTPVDRLPEATGVFVGSDACDYAQLVHAQGPEGIGHHTLTGLNRGLIANRLSHALGATGPSLSVDSAQSSSLVAVQLACDSLRNGDCELALAGGVHLNLLPSGTLAVAHLGALSPDAQCYTFDARANGFVRGEGAGLVVLKTLSKALTDGDRIHAVIRAGVVNNDGAGSGLTTPDAEAQATVLRQAYSRARVDPGLVDYVELHGTGTRAGDPVEATALGAVLGTAPTRGTPLRVGSVKTNIGHLEGAAGIAGLIKVVLCLAHGRLVPSLNYAAPNPAIDLDALGLRVQQEAADWRRADAAHPLVAGVSSFGMGGTNAHLVLEQAPKRPSTADAEPRPAGTDRPVVPWLVSARSSQALRAQTDRLAAHPTVIGPADPVDIAWSLLTTRTHFDHRAVGVGTDSDAILTALAASMSPGPAGDTVNKAVFVFPGQGSQWAGMAAELMVTSPEFAARLAECEAALAPHLDWSPTAVLRGDADAPPMKRVEVIQPVLWAVMVSLAELWRAHGVLPAAVAGHSQGEIAAAVVAGALSLEDGALVVALRSKALAAITGPGGMASVTVSRQGAEELIAPWGGRITVAALNGPSSTVVVGDAQALDELTVVAGPQGIRIRRVDVDYASHSAHVEAVRHELLRVLAPVTPRRPHVPFFSTVTGHWLDETGTDAAYWYANLRQPVLLEPAVRALVTAGHGAFVEVSPHPVLTVPLQQTAEAMAPDAPAVVTGTLRRDDGGLARFYTSLGELWTRGADVDWTPAFAGRTPATVDLPTYAFQRRRHWISGGAHGPETTATEAAFGSAPVAASGSGPEAAHARGDSLRLVRENAAVVLGHGDAQAVDITRSFKELGFDSVTAVELRDRLNLVTGLRLPSTVLYEHPSVTRLARHLDRKLSGTDAPATAALAVRPSDEPVAIVSMACRFPGGVQSPEDLWRLVRDEVDAVSAFPADRGWDLDTLIDGAAERPGTSYVREGGFLYDAAEFDAAFFGISPREALAMDPQQRLLLETVWEAVERAGLDPRSLQSTPTGVFVGATAMEYGPRLYEGHDDVEGHVLTGTATSVASGRIAYTLGLEGPAVTVDTACSSSLVALHMAVRSLRSGECSLALASGASVMAGPGMFTEFSRQRGLAPDGRCKPFAAGADGTGWAEGVGVLLLERLSDARRRGHRVLAVVRGSAVNQDGASNGLTAPSGPSQQRVIRAALADAGLSAADVDVVEAHGTGTKLGDPIEAQALISAYGQERAEGRPLWLGSVKSNIGHAQAAAGVAGVIKMVMAMRHGVLPKSLCAGEPTPHVDWSAGAVELLAEARPWEAEDRSRRAGVSSFGISGTNAHVILEQSEPLEEERTAPSAEPADGAVVPWLVSARTPQALEAQIERLDACVTATVPRAVEVGWSLLSGRTAFEYRAMTVGSDASAMVTALRAQHCSGFATDAVKPVFVFPGQGAQWVGMAVELLDSSPVFAARLGECGAALSGFVDWSLVDVVRGVEGAPGLERVDVVQPVLWAVMVSLAEVWRSFGVVPAAVVGHSQGEIAAAVVAGALSVEDGARVVALRSRALVRLAGRGGMVSVGLSRAGVGVLLARWEGRVSVAAVNGPSSVVVSGDADVLDELVAHCEVEGVRVRRIEVDYASHSAHVELIEEELAEVLEGLEPRVPVVPFLSTVTGEWVEGPVTDGGYWYANLRRTVQLESVVRTLATSGYGAFVEVSPHPVLSVPVAETVEAAGSEAVVAGTLRRGEGGLGRFYASLGEVWVRGVDVDWTPAFDGCAPKRVELPTYAFQRQRYWLEPSRPVVAADPVEARFWETVEREDLEGLAGTLGLGDQEALGEVLPALSSWRKGRQQRSTLDSWRYRVAWRPLARPAAEAALDGTWLLVIPEGYENVSLVQAVVGDMRERADSLRVLTLGIRDAEREALAGRLRAEAAHGPFTGVLSLEAIEEQPHPDNPSVPVGLAVSLALVQALGDAEIDAPLWCVTRGAVATEQDPAPTAPVQAGIWGLGRVAALEHPQRWGGLVDVPDAVEAADARTVPLLLDVVAGGRAAEDQVAVRGANVFGRRLVHAPCKGVTAPRGWKPRGTVLVTGGTGALGRRMARWLARNGAEHLVLTGRRGDVSPGMGELSAELEQRGPRVTVAPCDVSDRDALSALLREVQRDGTDPVRAVVHAAGVSPLGTLATAGVGDLAAALSGKVLGADHLHALLDPAQLDAVVYFSSISGTWGVADHGAYAAANAVLDACAERRRADGLPVLSVAWGPWTGGGMIAESVQDTLRRRGVPVIDPDTALAGLQQALDLDETFVAIADVDWRRFAGVFTSERHSPLLAELPEARTDGGDNPGSGSESALAERLFGLDPTERLVVLQELVREQVASVLGHDDAGSLEVERAFKELGFDSLTAVELRNRLVRATELRLPSTVVFDHPTIAALAAFLGELSDSGADPATDIRDSDNVESDDREDDDPIAIVSMGCRFPGGVRSPDDLWQLVRDEADAVSPLPADRGWDLDALYDPDPDRSGTSYVREGGFLYDAAEFDAAFFGISPREALAMDPQQRLLLEATWEALERGGLNPKALRGSTTGVYVGMGDQDYAARLRAATGEAEGYLATGAAASVASGRIAYTLGLEGPAVTVDTACSSSLVALHMAVRSLRSGECSLAVAAAVTVMTGPGQFVAFSRQRALAEDGRCKPFSAGADGFALSEGVGVLVLERLSDARRRGHRVLAVVRGSAVNQDGASNGLTAPSGPSQQRVIRAALADAGLSAADVDVVEAHGTGTKLGDPIEAQALISAYGQERAEGRPLWLGSVKSNIGHAQAASGMAGVIKMVMAMGRGVLPKSLHAEDVSPFVDWSAGAVELLAEAREWEADGRPRRAGVSSFGISGTNAHVILEQPEPVEEPSADTSGAEQPPVVPLTVSTRSSEALEEQVGRLLSHIRAHDLNPMDAGWSLQTDRPVFEHRAVLVGPNVVATGTATGDVSKPVFVFPGQGAQWVGMAVELLDSSPVFAARLGECEVALSGFVDWSLVDVVRGVEGAPGLDRVDVVQPVLWAVMVSLAEVWRAHGVVPAAVVGHSQGEIAAAVVAGALSVEDGARVVALRSRALVRLAGRGGMVSVGLSRAGVEVLLARWEGRVSVAAVNGPSSVVVSGDADALDELVAHCEVEGVRVRRIEVDYASHSAHVELIEEELSEVLDGLEPRVPVVPFLSTVTGEWVEGPVTDGGYWYANLRRTVQLESAVRRLATSGFGAFVEVSPHPVLSVPVAETVEAAGSGAVVAGTLRRGEGGLGRFYASLGEVWVRGVDVDWTSAFDGCAPKRVELPTYAFQRQRYWLEPSKQVVPISVGSDAVDKAFWETVEGEDLQGLAETLGLADPEALGEVLPALSSWRKGRQQRSTLDSWRYRVAWRPLARPAAEAGLDGTWLVAIPEGHEDDGFVQNALGVLQASGARISEFSVRAGADRAELAGRLVAELDTDEPLGGILSLLALNDLDSDRSRGVSCGLLGTVALVQALDDTGLHGRLWCVTRGAVSTGPDDIVTHPARAAVWGLARVIGLDTPDRWGGLVDLPATDGEPGLKQLPALLAGVGATSVDGGGRETEFAVRAAGVFGRRMVRFPLKISDDLADKPSGMPSTAAALPETSPTAGELWQPRGTVLITGGTGALGSRVARVLARDGAEHLLLTSRQGSDAPGAEGLRRELTETGCRVTIASCDVADRAALAAVIGAVPGDLPLTAVVHTAGAVDAARPLGDLSEDDVIDLLRAKVTGAVNLDELLNDHPLEAFVLFSSGAGVWGNGGQAPYAAANAHLDALAERRQAQGLPATSIAWGAWAGGGMVDVTVAEQLSRRGVPPMEPESAVRALREAVAGRETTLVVADIRWDRFLPAYCAHGHRPLLDEVPEVGQLLDRQRAERTAGAGERSDVPSALLRELAELPEAKRVRRIIGLVRTHARSVLGHATPDTVKASQAFRDMGFDSLTAVELRNRLGADFGTRLSATVVFDYPTPKALADHLNAELLRPVGAAPAGLEQVEAALRQATDPAAREAFAEGLRALLDTWADNGDSPQEPTVDEELITASDQDMFDLIDRELGNS